MPRLVDAEFLADMTSGRVRMDVRATMERLVYTKSKDWEYEKEWRISSGTGRNPEARGEDIPFNALELDAVEAGEEEGHAEPEFGDSILEAAWHALDQTVQAQAAELIGDGALEDRFRVASGQS